MSEYKTEVLTDSQKFSIMTVRYDALYGDYLTFSMKIDAGKTSVNDWARRGTKRTIGHISKTQICKIFRLNSRVWTDTYYDEISFSQALYQYEQITDQTLRNKIDKKMVGPKPRLIGTEEDELTELDIQNKITINFEKLEHKSLLFTFELIPLLISKNQLQDALNIIKYLQSFDSTFKLYHYNQLEHYKAIIYSHSSIREWDKAIEILRFLYSVSNYHLQEHEIITLMASNYKRKALTLISDGFWCNVEDADLDLLDNAIVLYDEAYEYKTNDEKYYDAINLAYLYKFLEALENDDEVKSTKSIDALYEKLTLNWTYDRKNWWEVSTTAEFFMLQGNITKAINEMKYFLELESVKEFEIEATLRQLEMYIHFTKDENAKELYLFLKNY